MLTFICQAFMWRDDESRGGIGKGIVLQWFEESAKSMTGGVLCLWSHRTILYFMVRNSGQWTSWLLNTASVKVMMLFSLSRFWFSLDLYLRPGSVHTNLHYTIECNVRLRLRVTYKIWNGTLLQSQDPCYCWGLKCLFTVQKWCVCLTTWNKVYCPLGWFRHCFGSTNELGCCGK